MGQLYIGIGFGLGLDFGLVFSSSWLFWELEGILVFFFFYCYFLFLDLYNMNADKSELLFLWFISSGPGRIPWACTGKGPAFVGGLLSGGLDGVLFVALCMGVVTIG